MGNYDAIFLGFPIWWYIAPPIIITFLERDYFTGKTIVPFATSGGSGIGNAVDELKKNCSPVLQWKTGKLVNAPFTNEELLFWAKEYTEGI